MPGGWVKPVGRSQGSNVLNEYDILCSSFSCHVYFCRRPNESNRSIPKVSLTGFARGFLLSNLLALGLFDADATGDDVVHLVENIA